jgi:lipopolysaccharide transport system permease protein
MNNTKTYIIESGKSESAYWADLWNFRELFTVLSKRDISVRYKQTVIGIFWAVIKPLLTMLVFTFVFNKIAKLNSNDGTPYELIVFAALIPWTFFSTGLTESSNSLIGNANLISKVYFPRLIIPTSSIITSFVDMIINIIMLVIMLIVFHYTPSPRIVFLPVLMFLSFAATLGPGLLFTALSVKYRDFRYVVPFIVQFGLYISPIGYSSSFFSIQYKWIYYLNPLTGIIDLFRWAIFGKNFEIYFPGLLISMIIIVLLLIIGLTSFRKMEKTFADLI